MKLSFFNNMDGTGGRMRSEIRKKEKYKNKYFINIYKGINYKEYKRINYKGIN